MLVERDAELKNCERLRSKNQQLKEADATRGKALDEERQAVAKLKADLRQQIEDCNRRLRSALESLNEYKRAHSVAVIEEVDGAGSPDTSAQEADQGEAEQTSTTISDLELKAKNLEEKLTMVEGEKNKLEENLGETLKEFKKLDDFSTNLQSQYEAIHAWYGIFEEWNRSAKCSSCNASLDVASIIDKLLENAKQESSTPSTASAQSQH